MLIPVVLWAVRLSGLFPSRDEQIDIDFLTEALFPAYGAGMHIGDLAPFTEAIVLVFLVLINGLLYAVLGWLLSHCFSALRKPGA